MSPESLSLRRKRFTEFCLEGPLTLTPGFRESSLSGKDGHGDVISPHVPQKNALDKALLDHAIFSCCTAATIRSTM